MVRKDIGANVKIAESAKINVTEYLHIGAGTVINEHVTIEGRFVSLGRECWLDEHASIGGGSCFDFQSMMKAGDFLHMGKRSHINTARRVVIGDECGIGMDTKIFTHGAYESAFEGFPVMFGDVIIGNNVWLPNAYVLPGTHIGNNVVVSAMSLVNRDLPKGCLAGGVPVKIIKENVYPRELTIIEEVDFIEHIIEDVNEPAAHMMYSTGVLSAGPALFNIKGRMIFGKGNEFTEKVKNQLRRYGIRFRYSLVGGEYKSWEY